MVRQLPLRALADSIIIVSLDRTDVAVISLLNDYRRAHGMTTGGVSDDGSQWYGLFMDNELCVVFADRRFDGCIFVENICPVPGRHGVLGTYALLGLYRAAVDSGEVRTIAGSVLLSNPAQLRAMKRVFGIERPVPVAQIWLYKGKR